MMGTIPSGNQIELENFNRGNPNQEMNMRNPNDFINANMHKQPQNSQVYNKPNNKMNPNVQSKTTKTSSMPPFGNVSNSDQMTGPFNKSTPTPQDQQNINGILKQPRMNRQDKQRSPEFSRNDGRRRDNYRNDDQYYDEEGDSYGDYDDEEGSYGDEYSKSYDLANQRVQSSPLKGG